LPPRKIGVDGIRVHPQTGRQAFHNSNQRRAMRFTSRQEA